MIRKGKGRMLLIMGGGERYQIHGQLISQMRKNCGTLLGTIIVSFNHEGKIKFLNIY